jgi:BirA family biotin operon repressor/biotin-[acetyl-CoA-carboxylase] ligase
MAAALGVSAFLESMGLTPSAKWPNDVRVRTRKIAGILAERAAVKDTACVVGIGLNVNMTSEEASGIDQPATSLRIETHAEHDVRQVLVNLLPHLRDWVVVWERSGFEGLRSAWMEHCDFVGQRVDVREGDTSVRGIVDDFGANGELLLRLPDGVVRAIWSGDLASF